MSRALLIAVRFHEGRYHGAGDWPPSPGRLFQALVAAASRGARIAPGDAEALRWLERLAPPEIVAPAATVLRGFTTFVPNNDRDSVERKQLSSTSQHQKELSKIRVGKTFRPHLFDADKPILYLWRHADAAPEAERVGRIALRLHQLGRGIDMAWASAETLDDAEAEARLAGEARHLPGGTGPVAVPTAGTLDSLIARHEGFRRRFAQDGAGRAARRSFTQPPKPLLRRVAYDAPPRRLLFDLRRENGAFAPQPLADAGALTAGFRDRAAAWLARALPAQEGEQEGEVRRLLVGRGAGPRDKARRVRLWPVPSIGHAEADPSIRRLVVEVPPDCPLHPEDLAWAFSRAGIDPETGEIADWSLSPAEDERMAERYRRPAALWRTITAAAVPAARRRRIDPVAPPDKPGSERAAEETRAATSVLAALRHAGVTVDPVAIRVQREPFQRRGAGAEAFAAGTRFAKHALWHVELRFARSMAGPLLIGDGRFCGLGLMVPVNETPDPHVFRIAGGFGDAGMHEAAAALRRAVMARVREATGSPTLAPFFTGHAEDGGPLRKGLRAHVACVADLARGRLLVIAPHLLDRRAPSAEERRHLRDLARAMDGFETLRLTGGAALRLRADPPEEDDPLIAPARLWESATPYRPTRHPKRETPADRLAADAVEECRRRGLPEPAVEVLSVEEGPRGGSAARLRLRFRVAVRGPILLGRDAQRGGGLFAIVKDV